MGAKQYFVAVAVGRELIRLSFAGYRKGRVNIFCRFSQYLNNHKLSSLYRKFTFLSAFFDRPFSKKPGQPGNPAVKICVFVKNEN